MVRGITKGLVIVVAALCCRLAFGALVDEEGCKRFYVDTNPNGDARYPWSRQCDRATIRASGMQFRPDASNPPLGWLQEGAPIPSCGDQLVNRPEEQCDAPNGMGSIGSCSSILDCIQPGQPNECTCVPASTTCPNGMLDPGEGCDPGMEDGPCGGTMIVNGVVEPKCTGDCKCRAQCPNGIIETGTTTGVDENCEFGVGGGGSGADFGSAPQFTGPPSGSTTGPYINSNLDAAAGGAGTDGPFDFTTHDMVVEMLIRVDAWPGTQARLVSKGGTATTTPGWSVGLLSNGGLRLYADDNAGVNMDCQSDADSSTPEEGRLTPGSLYHVAVVRELGECRFWFLNITEGETVHSNVTGSGAGDDIGTLWDQGSTTVAFGASSGTGNNPFTGLIDEMRIWGCLTTGCADTYEASTMNQLWDEEVSSGTNLRERWGFDQTPTTLAGSINSSVLMTIVGNVPLVSSPFTAAVGGGGIGEFGCTAPEFCDPTACRCKSTGGPPLNTFYMDDANCDNANTGRTVGTGTGNGGPEGPWCTVAWALGANNPRRMSGGDTLIIRNGMYSQNVNIVGGDVMPALNGGVCNGVGANAPCGSSGSPITIKAENERQAIFTGNGVSATWSLAGVQHYVIDGITAQGTDNPSGSISHVFAIAESNNITHRGVLANRTDRCGNTQAIEYNDCMDCLCEKCEIWRHTRHGFSISGGQRVTIRNAYVNNAIGVSNVTTGFQCPGAAGCPSGCATSGGTGQGSFAVYPCNNCTIENSFMEGSFAGGIQSATGGFANLRAQDNWIVNSVFVPRIGGGSSGGTGSKIYSRDSDSRGVKGSRLWHNLYLNALGFSIRDSVSIATVIDNVTIWNNAMSSVASLSIDDPSAEPTDSQDTCGNVAATSGETISVTVSDSILTDNGTPPDVAIQDCAIGARTCTFTNNHADSCNGSSECSCTGFSTGLIPSGIGDSGFNCYHGSATRGADLRCKTFDRVKQSGAANSLFCENASIPGCAGMHTTNANCTADRSSGPTVACQNGLSICGAVVDGINDVEGCATFAHRYMRQLADDSECGNASSSVSLACP